MVKVSKGCTLFRKQQTAANSLKAKETDMYSSLWDTCMAGRDSTLD